MASSEANDYYDSTTTTSASTTSASRTKTSSSDASNTTSTSQTSSKETSRHSSASSTTSTSSTSSSSHRTRQTTTAGDSSTTVSASATATSRTADTLSTSVPLSSATYTLVGSSTSTHPSSTLSQSTTAAPTTASLAAAAASTTAAIAANSTHQSGVSPGVIAAAVVIPVVVLTALAALLFFFFRRRHRSRQAFARQSSQSTRSDPPSPVADLEQPSEKVLELSPIERKAPTLQVIPVNGLTVPRRPVGLAVADAEPQITSPASEFSLSPRWTPSNDPPMTPHHPSGALLLPTLPEVDTSQFFGTPQASSHGHRDPFNDPSPGYTPSPIERSQIYPGNRSPAENPIHSSTTYNAITMPSQPHTLSTAIRSVQPAFCPANLPPPLPTGLYPPILRIPGGESNRNSMMSADEDEEGNDDFSIVEYASAARVAQVAQVVSGPAGRDGEVQSGTSNRRSVGVISVRPGRESISHRSHGSQSSTASGASSPVL